MKKLSDDQINEIVNEKLGWRIINIKRNKGKTHVDLIDNQGYMYSNVYIDGIKKQQIPWKFHSSNIYTIQNINRWCELNNLNIKLVGEYKGIKENLKWKCMDCNQNFYRDFNNFKQGKFLCPYCNDSISYPNKFMRNMLDQLNIDYKPEFSPKWISPKRYDFYFELNNKKYIIEMDGALGHGNDRSLDGLTPEKTKTIDDYKDKKAKEHNIEIIRIDAQKSKMEYIRDNILSSELLQIFDLSQIDWIKCYEFGLKSLVKETCDLWNSGIKNTKEVGKIMNLDCSTIRRYLKQGTQLGWCDYNSKQVMMEVNRNNGVNNKKKFNKPVIQLTLDGKLIKEFESAKEAERQTGADNRRISMCCNNKRKKTNGYRWMFKENYKKIS